MSLQCIGMLPGGGSETQMVLSFDGIQWYLQYIVTVVIKRKDSTMLNLWHLAKEIEAEGRKMYKELAYTAPKKTISSIFITIAGEEQLHYELFDKLEKGTMIIPANNEPVNNDFKKKIFEVIHIELLIEELPLPVMHDAEIAYKQALVLENSSMELFNIILRKLTDEHQKLVVGRIVEEEKRHVEIIGKLMKLVHRPEEWIENAEVFNYSRY